MQLVSKESRPNRANTIVKIGDIKIGGNYNICIAGPCAVENEIQLYQTACHIKKLGVPILRGGAFKPRTSPYSFKGLGLEGLKLLQKVGQATGLKVVSEVMNIRDLDLVAQYVDILQIGSRNMQNFSLLEEAGKIHKPVLLKRGMSATIEEWLLAAEYIMLAGNPNVILCERGIRTFETYTRNTLDISAVAIAKQLTHLPVIVDPSHGSGRRELIIPLSRAALAAGADGIMVEVHPHPENALSDGPQSLDFADFTALMAEINAKSLQYKNIN